MIPGGDPGNGVAGTARRRSLEGSTVAESSDGRLNHLGFNGWLVRVRLVPAAGSLRGGNGRGLRNLT